MPSFAYYISGHGFGHARRSAEIISALLQRNADLTVHVRTSAPRFIFNTIANPRAIYHPSETDTGVVERDPLNLDIPATLAKFRALLDRADPLVRAESDFLKTHHVSLVLADVPFLAGEIAARTAIPCLAVTNFTWDWIFDPLATSATDRDLVARIRDAYSKMSGLIRLPFGHDNPRFPRTVDVPLVANRSRRPREQTLADLNLSHDERPRILVGMRGGVSPESLRHAASLAPRHLFIYPYELPGPLPQNIITANCDAGCTATFADLMSISDLVISKLGYGIVADCIAARTRLVWPRRNDFREDELTAAGSRRYIAHRELPTNDFYEGNWNDHIEALLAEPMPTEHAGLDGPEVAARIISEWR